MSRAPQNFRETDIRRAVKAALAAGAGEVRVEITKGKIVVMARKKSAEVADEGSGGDEWGNI